MPIGIVSDDIFDSELVQNSIPEPQILKPIIIEKNNGGRPQGSLEVPNTIRKIIGDTAIESGRQDALAVGEFFDVSKSSVSAYTHGVTSTATYNTPDKSLSRHINVTKERIAKRAANKLNKTFNALTDDKFSEASGPELATMAKSFATIIKDMSPEAERTPGPQVQFVIHTPPIAKESRFDVITVNE